MQEKLGNKTGWKWGVVAALGLLAGGSWWFSGGSDPKPTTSAVLQPQARPAVASEAAAAMASTAMAANLQTRQPVLAATEQGVANRTIDQELKQIEAQWCSHGQLAHRQVEASISQSFARDDFKRAESLSRQPYQQAQYLVRSRLLHQWAQRLKNQGDERSRATAAYLILSLRRDWEAEWAQELSWMQAAALRSTDPYLLHLWSKDPGECQRKKQCQGVPAARMVEVEPANLKPWLRAVFEGASPSEAQWRGMAQASYARSYDIELQSRLLALAGSLPPGLELQVALDFIRSDARRGSQEMVTLGRICKTPEAVRTRKATCLHAADLIWRQEQATYDDKVEAFLLVGSFAAFEDAPWADRAAALMALGPSGLSAVDKAQAGVVPFKECVQLPNERKRLTDLAKLGVWRATLGDAADVALR